MNLNNQSAILYTFIKLNQANYNKLSIKENNVCFIEKYFPWQIYLSILYTLISILHIYYVIIAIHMYHIMYCILCCAILYYYNVVIHFYLENVNMYLHILF